MRLNSIPVISTVVDESVADDVTLIGDEDLVEEPNEDIFRMLEL